MTFAAPHTGSEAVFRVCFVCTGNICRSPMAEVVFRALVAAGGVGDNIAVSSAGTGDWHVGEQADRRTLEALTKRGFNGSRHRAKQFDPAWFSSLDLVVVLDHGQHRILTSWALNESDQSKVRLLLGFENHPGIAGDVPDPYYSDAAAFDSVLSTIERACGALYSQLEPAIRYGDSQR